MLDKTIDEISKLLMLLEIEKYPFSMKQLDDNFKRIIMLYHPDKNKNEDANEKSSEIIDAYNKLKSYASDFDEKEHKKSLIKESIFDFFKECYECKGTGFISIIVRSNNSKNYNCIKCKDTGFIKVKCNKCNEGKFTLKNGRIVNCKACEGTGIYKLKCNHIISLIYMFWEERNVEYIEKKIECKSCNGTGEIRYEPINPVIRKGAIL